MVLHVVLIQELVQLVQLGAKVTLKSKLGVFRSVLIRKIQNDEIEQNGSSAYIFRVLNVKI